MGSLPRGGGGPSLGLQQFQHESALFHFKILDILKLVLKRLIYVIS